MYVHLSHEYVNATQPSTLARLLGMARTSLLTRARGGFFDTEDEEDGNDLECKVL